MTKNMCIPAVGAVIPALLLALTNFAAWGQATKDSSKEQPQKVTMVRVPYGGIQPQAVVDTKGAIHLIYFSGNAAHGDIFYVRSDDTEHFSRPLRVNSHPGSAIAVGNIRGAQLALGRDTRVHIVWMGSERAEPRGQGNLTPMLYTRLNDAGTAFEPERNIIHKAYGLDGGGSVAADSAGNVYVLWHAPEPGQRGEEHRCVWVVHSVDDGATFAPDKRANPDDTGACGCCGMRAYGDKDGKLLAMYRSATQAVHRVMYLLTSTDKAGSFQGEKLHGWDVGTCPMSSMAFAEAPGADFAAWETAGQVYFCRVDSNTGKRSRAVAPPGNGNGRKHPAFAVSVDGEILMAWTEGTGWERGGSLAWQVFNRELKPTDHRGRADGVPIWSLVAVVPRNDGGFTIYY